MMTFFLLLMFGFVLVPSSVFAWGPLTHMYLGNEVTALSPLIPAGIFAIIRKYRQDFLYGNLMADIIIGKKFLPKDKNTHSWEVGLSLLNNSKSRQQRAFSLGYLSHLAADTVAHEIFTRHKRNIGHTLYELKADSIVDKSHWFQAIAIDKAVQKRNDTFMERSLARVMFSFKTNKRIFKGMFILSLFNREAMSDFIDKNLGRIPIPHRREIEYLHEKSVDRILDVLENGSGSSVLRENPGCKMPPGRFFKPLHSGSR